MKLMRTKVGGFLTVVAISAMVLIAVAYPTLAACNGQTSIAGSVTSTHPSCANGCVKVVQADCTCADPYPPNANVHCVRQAGTVTTTTYNGTCCSGGITGYFAKCVSWAIGISFSCQKCIGMAQGLTGTTSGYTCNT